jgi:hypothetical protein
MQLIEEFPFKRRRNCIYKHKNDEKGNHFHYDMQISIYVYKKFVYATSPTFKMGVLFLITIWRFVYRYS